MSKVKKIFISYRRADTSVHADAIYRRLTEQFGESNVFFDVEKIDLGDEFARIIDERIASCDVVLVLIGPKWLALDVAGRRRLDQPGDYVRREIAAALSRDIRVIPVLVGGAGMPAKDDLPEEVAALATRSALEVSDTRLNQDIDDLIAQLGGRRIGQALRELVARLKLRRRARVIVPVCVLIMFIAAWVQLFDRFGGWDTSIASYTMELGSLFRSPQPSDQIAIVAITQDTERHVGRPLDKTWRREHAQLIDALSRSGAKSIAFDMYLNEPGPHDNELIAAMQSAKARGTAVIFGTERGASPVADVEQAASGIGLLCAGTQQGQATLAPLAVDGKRKLAALSVLAANQGGLIEEIDQENRQIFLRTPAGQLKRIKFSTIEQVSKEQVSKPRGDCPVLEEGDTVAQLIIEFCALKQLRDPARRHRYEDISAELGAGDRFTGKIVLVGQENESDTMNVGFRNEERYGFEVHADMLNTLLKGTRIHPVGLWEQFFVMLAMGALGAAPRFYRPLASPVLRRCYLGAVLASYIALAIWLYVKYEVLLNMLYHLGTLFIAYWALGKAARRLGLWDTDDRKVARSSTRGSALRLLILLTLVAAQAGYGSLTTVREVLGSATVIQQGRAIPARANMLLKTGDELRTQSGSTVILHFLGSEVYVLPQTRVRIDSIFVFVGKVFVRAKGKFAVKTEFVTAGVEGTEFWVGVGAKNAVSVGVFNGSVRLESRTGLWRPVSVTRNQVFRIPQQQPPSKDLTPQDDLDRIRQLVEGMDKRKTRGTPKPWDLIPPIIDSTLAPLLPGRQPPGSPGKSPGSVGPPGKPGPSPGRSPLPGKKLPPRSPAPVVE